MMKILSTLLIICPALLLAHPYVKIQISKVSENGENGDNGDNGGGYSSKEEDSSSEEGLALNKVVIIAPDNELSLKEAIGLVDHLGIKKKPQQMPVESDRDDDITSIIVRNPQQSFLADDLNVQENIIPEIEPPSIKPIYSHIDHIRVPVQVAKQPHVPPKKCILCKQTVAKYPQEDHEEEEKAASPVSTGPHKIVIPSYIAHNFNEADLGTGTRIAGEEAAKEPIPGLPLIDHMKAIPPLPPNFNVHARPAAIPTDVLAGLGAGKIAQRPVANPLLPIDNLLDPKKTTQALHKKATPAQNQPSNPERPAQPNILPQHIKKNEIPILHPAQEKRPIPDERVAQVRPENLNFFAGPKPHPKAAENVPKKQVFPALPLIQNPLPPQIKDYGMPINFPENGNPTSKSQSPVAPLPKSQPPIPKEGNKALAAAPLPAPNPPAAAPKQASKAPSPPPKPLAPLPSPHLPAKSQAPAPQPVIRAPGVVPEPVAKVSVEKPVDKTPAIAITQGARRNQKNQASQEALSHINYEINSIRSSTKDKGHKIKDPSESSSEE